MDTISQTETANGNRPKEPTSRDTADGIAALRIGRALLDPLKLAVHATVLSALVAEFLARFPANSRGEMLRMLTAQVSGALELMTDEPPPDATA